MLFKKYLVLFALGMVITRIGIAGEGALAEYDQKAIYKLASKSKIKEDLDSHGFNQLAEKSKILELTEKELPFSEIDYILYNQIYDYVRDTDETELSQMQDAQAFINRVRTALFKSALKITNE